MLEEKQVLSSKQSQFIQESLAYVRAKRVLREGERVLVAVSGGLDSSVLLHSLSRMSRLLGIQLEVAHVDHRTRGQASERESVWVKVLVERLNLKLHAVQVAAPLKSNQEELRNLRRQALTELADDLQCSVIATAHHADDNAETFLMRVMSGTGVSALAGMQPRDGIWAKPLLWSSRSQLETYARDHRLAWVEDPSNLRSTYLRNHIRNILLPQVEQARQGSIRNLAKIAERVQEEESDWEEWFAGQMQGPKETLSIAWLERWPAPLQRRVMRYWLRELGLTPSPHLMEALLRGDELIHPAGSFLRRSDMLVFSKENDFSEEWQTPKGLEFSRRLSLGSSLAWSFLPSAPERSTPLPLSILAGFTRPGQRYGAASLLFSWDRAPWPMNIRCITATELQRFTSVFDAFRIPKPYRSKWPVLVNQEREQEVIAIFGLKVLEPYAAVGDERAVAIHHFYDN
ncbi:tRNA lysidine(34) synthetase TilS [bacterium]|nr:tRNA lysidine(34) synthetase TilS [bacterium]